MSANIKLNLAIRSISENTGEEKLGMTENESGTTTPGHSRNSSDINNDQGFVPAKSRALLERLPSTEYFEGCANPEQMFGSNLSQIMASLTLKSNDDINLADFATPKPAANGMRSKKFPDIQPMKREPYQPLPDEFIDRGAAPRRHSSIIFASNQAGDLAGNNTEINMPPGFIRSRYNSRSYGSGNGLMYNKNDNLETISEDNNYAIPTSMLANSPRFSVTNSRRRVTLDGVNQNFQLGDEDMNQGLRRDGMPHPPNHMDSHLGSGSPDREAPDLESTYTRRYGSVHQNFEGEYGTNVGSTTVADPIPMNGLGLYDNSDAFRRASRRHSTPSGQHMPPIGDSGESMGALRRTSHYSKGNMGGDLNQDYGMTDYHGRFPGKFNSMSNPYGGMQPDMSEGWFPNTPQLHGMNPQHIGLHNAGPHQMYGQPMHFAPNAAARPDLAFNGAQLKKKQMKPRGGKASAMYPQSALTADMSDALRQYKLTGTTPNFEDLLGHVIEFSSDSNGSRLIQFKMEIGTEDERQCMIEEILPEVVSLAAHPFGNYVVQNFLQHSSEQQRILVATHFKGSVMRLSTHNHGCRVVQFALDVLPIGQRNILIDEVVENVEVIAKNNHGTHVIQKTMGILTHDTLEVSVEECEAISAECLQAGAPSSIDLLRKVEGKVAADLLKLANHQHSYRLVQLTMANCDENRSAHLKTIMKQVKDNYQALALDQHGNFILQHILDAGSPEQAADVQDFVASKVLMLSQHKFGSHLVEKCLSTADPQQISAIVLQVLEPTEDNLRYLERQANSSIHQIEAEHKADIMREKDHYNALLLLSKDPYANFVVQKAYKIVPPALKSRLGNEIQKISDLLSRFAYGRHILSHVV